VIAGALVVALALPLFLAAGWSITAWSIATALWVAVQTFGLIVTRVGRDSSLKAAGLAGFLMIFRLLIVVVVLATLAATHKSFVLPVLAVYGLAYTCELALSLATYFGNEPL